MSHVFRSCCLILVFYLAQTSLLWGESVPQTPEDWAREAISTLCVDPKLSGIDTQNRLKGSWLLKETYLPSKENPQRISMDFVLPRGDEINIERRLFQTNQRQFRLTYFERNIEQTSPLLFVITDNTCSIQSSRKIRTIGPIKRFMDHLDKDLKTILWSEALQLPWPEGSDPGGPRVGLVDSGLAYDLPQIRNHLARGPDGKPLGYDFWDLDPWPYDGDTSQSPFILRRHGTPVASVMIREAPSAALIPYRYPRPDMGRMGDLVHHAAKNKVKILAIALGSRRISDWDNFARALDKHDILAVVSAGNDGMDIDKTPVYPAALDHEKIIVVTSADNAGRLAQGSNWGSKTVDLMLPAENVPVIDFRGAKGKASGSSYAVPRLAALAARLLIKNPKVSATDLKQLILSRAVSSPFEREGVLSSGWIPDPTDD